MLLAILAEEGCADVVILLVVLIEEECVDVVMPKVPIAPISVELVSERTRVLVFVEVEVLLVDVVLLVTIEDVEVEGEFVVFVEFEVLLAVLISSTTLLEPNFCATPEVVFVVLDVLLVVLIVIESVVVVVMTLEVFVEFVILIASTTPE